MSETKFVEPSRSGRFIDFCFFTLPWFIFGCIGIYKNDPDAYLFFVIGWVIMTFDAVLKNRSTLAQTRKEIAELKELIKNKK